MDQVNFMNCPEKIYKENADAYEKTKMFVESKQKAGECGRMVKDLFLIAINMCEWNEFCFEFYVFFPIGTTWDFFIP